MTPKLGVPDSHASTIDSKCMMHFVPPVGMVPPIGVGQFGVVVLAKVADGDVAKSPPGVLQESVGVLFTQLTSGALHGLVAGSASTVMIFELLSDTAVIVRDALCR